MKTVIYDETLWKLVPIEPTEEMINSALNCQECDPEDGPDSEVYYSYKAMLEASPTPPTKSEPSNTPEGVDIYYSVVVKEHGGGSSQNTRIFCLASKGNSEPSKDTCNHEWVSARNEVIQSGSICIKCYAMSAEDLPSNDHIVNNEEKEKEDE